MKKIVLRVAAIGLLALSVLFLVLGVPYPRWLIQTALIIGLLAAWIFWVAKIRGRPSEKRATAEKGLKIFLALIMGAAVLLLLVVPHTSPFVPAPEPTVTPIPTATLTSLAPSPYEGWGVIVLERLPNSASQETTEVVLSDPLLCFGGWFYVVPDEYGPTLEAGPSQSGEMFDVSFLGKVAIGGGNRYLLFPYCESGEFPAEVRAGNSIQVIPSWKSGNGVYCALSSITCE